MFPQAKGSHCLTPTLNGETIALKLNNYVKGSRMGHSVKVSLWCVTL